VWESATSSWRAYVQRGPGEKAVELGNFSSEIGAAIEVLKKRSELHLKVESIYSGPKDGTQPDVVLIQTQGGWQIRAGFGKNEDMYVAGHSSVLSTARNRAFLLMHGLGKEVTKKTEVRVIQNEQENPGVDGGFLTIKQSSEKLEVPAIKVWKNKVRISIELLVGRIRTGIYKCFRAGWGKISSKFSSMLNRSICIQRCHRAILPKF